MNVETCIKFANDNPTSYLATCDGTQPRVRSLLLWYADKTGLYYNIGAKKDVFAQLKLNPKVEVCFFDTKSKNMTSMRVTGKIEFLDDMKTKEKLLDARPFLKKWGMTPESPDLVVFRLAKCTAHFWTLETNFQPKEYVKFG